jgi:DNA-binding MarR family transcriptional regulator
LVKQYAAWMVLSPDPVAATAEPAWAKQLAHLLWEAWARAAPLREEGLAGTSLSLPSLGLLDAVTTWPGITVAELSRRTPKTPQAISQTVARLEMLGYLERRLRSGRGVGLHVTAAGAAAHRQGAASEEAVEQQLRDLLGPDRYDQLRSLLHQACALLAETEVSGPS